MFKLYLVDGNKYWFNEGDQPDNAIEVETKKATKKAEDEVETKVVEPKNKVVKTTKRK